MMVPAPGGVSACTDRLTGSPTFTSARNPPLALTRTTGWIPPNLLNEGRASVEAGIWSLNGFKLLPHGHRHDAVSFHVFDPGDGGSARGRFVGQLRGPVRPLLEWTTESG